MTSPVNSKKLDRSLLAVCLVVLSASILYPTLRLLYEALNVWSMPAILEGNGRQAILNTLIISLLTVLCAGIVGTVFALCIARYRFPGRNLLAALAYLPFTLPPLVGVLAFYYLIGRDGLFPRFWSQTLDLGALDLTGPAAILIIHTYSFYVFFYTMLSAALENMDQAPLEAARTLGASRTRTLLQVTLPMLRPALLGAALLTFMSSGASFSAPYYFGADFPMLSVAIFNARSQYDNPAALTLTLVLALVALLGILLFRAQKSVKVSASKGTPTPIRSASGKFITGALAWIIMFLLLLPHITILWCSFVDYAAWQTELIPTQFTWKNYATIFSASSALVPIRNSFWMSALATLATLAMALPAAYLIAKQRPGYRFINFLVMIPWALPGTVIAINLIAAFNDPWLPLYTTVWLLPVAYFVRNVPLLTRMATAAIQQFDPTLLEAARSLGAPPMYCAVRIILPLLAPAIIAASALTFALCLGEFVASILLYNTANIPISVHIDKIWRSEVGPAFAYAVLLMLLVTAAFLLARKFSTRLL